MILYWKTSMKEKITFMAQKNSEKSSQQKIDLLFCKKKKRRNNKKSNPHFLYFSFQLEVPDKMSCHPLLNQESDEEEERKSDKTRMKR